jgi:uncharacterized protein
VVVNEANKQVVRDINRGFETGDDDLILSCLADDIVWHVPPYFTARGKDEFKTQIRSPDADGPPAIELRHFVAEGSTVTVEGHVTNNFKNGSLFRGLFHNAYRLRDGKIFKMTSYVVPLPAEGWTEETK